MKNYEDNQKPNRKKNFGQKKTKFLNEEDNLIKKANKEFKHKRRLYTEEEDDWKNWDLEHDQ